MVRGLIATGLAVGALTLGVSGCGGSDESGTASTPASQNMLAGHWRGQLQQKGLPPFTVSAAIESPAGSSGNRVHYTGIDCSGRWTYLSAAGSSYRFREVIDRGSGGKCKGVGIVTLTTERSPDRLGYEFRGGGVASQGTLRRVS